MVRCPTCADWISESDGECSNCRSTEFCNRTAKPSDESHQQPASDDESGELQAIAQFRHAAEAGFFLDELTRRLDITAEVAPRERFDSLHASWSTDFVLLVPRPSATAAAQCLQELVEQNADASDGLEPTVSPPPTRSAFSWSGMKWIPLTLTFAAGAVTCWGFERLDRLRVAPARPAGQAATSRLLEELSSVPHPWTQSIPKSKASRRATFDQRTHKVLWEEDRDGDGRFEIQRSLALPD